MLFDRYASEIKTVILDGTPSIEEFVAVARYGAKVELSEAYLKRVNDSRKALEDKLNSGTPVYGVNTGFGDNVRYRIGDDEMVKLQENILRSHGTAFGEPIKKDLLRCIMLFMLNNIGKGYSAVSEEVVQLVREYLNRDVYPYVPAGGGTGSLTSMPYFAITLMGEGRIIDDDGSAKPAAEVLEKKGLKPLRIKAREGLGILNSQPSVCEFVLTIYDLTMALRHGDICAAMVCEALGTTDMAYHPRLMELKGRPEAIEMAAYMRKALSDSKIMEHARKVKVQDCVSSRIIPHMHSTVKRMLQQSFDVVMEELRAVNDNPVFLEDGTALMGGNWDTSAIALYADSMSIAVCNLAKLFEVHMERLVNPNLSGLPAFLVKKPGLNNGFMIVQYVTADLLGEITFLANSGSSYTCTVSAGQEAPAYGDAGAVFKLHDAVSKLNTLITYTMMTALQALDFRTKDMGTLSQKVFDEARKTVTFMEEDDLMYPRIEAMEALVASNKLLDIAQETVGDFTL